MDQSPPTGSWGKSWFPSGTGKDWSQWRVGDLGCGRLGGAGPLIQVPGPASPPVLETSRFSTGTAWQAGTLDFQATPVSSVRPAPQRWVASLGAPPSCLRRRFLASSLLQCKPANLLLSPAVLRIPLASIPAWLLARHSHHSLCLTYRFAAFAASQVSPTPRPPSADPRRSRTSRAETPSELRDLNYSTTLVCTTPNTERT